MFWIRHGTYIQRVLIPSAGLMVHLECDTENPMVNNSNLVQEDKIFIHS